MQLSAQLQYGECFINTIIEAAIPIVVILTAALQHIALQTKNIINYNELSTRACT